MPVRLNSSGGGSVTLDVPATGTTTTLTLPITGGGLAASGSVTTSGLTMNTSRLLGRTTASSGAVEEISIGGGLSLAGTVLTGAPQPQSGGGVGQWTILYAAPSANLDLPAGGTWAYLLIQRATSTLGLSTVNAGVAAGGGRIGNGSAGVDHFAMAWRIA